MMHDSQVHEDWRITLVNTGLHSMTGFRTKICGKYIEEDNFMLTYGDAVSNVNIGELVEFHKMQNTVGTVTGVFPPSRFGDLVVQNNKVIRFKQQLKDVENQAPINGGFFVFKRSFLDTIDDNPEVNLENEPMDRLVREEQLSVFHHREFWQCMDTYRDNQLLEKMWMNNPLWKVWRDEC